MVLLGLLVASGAMASLAGFLLPPLIYGCWAAQEVPQLSATELEDAVRAAIKHIGGQTGAIGAVGIGVSWEEIATIPDSVRAAIAAKCDVHMDSIDDHSIVIVHPRSLAE